MAMTQEIIMNSYSQKTNVVKYVGKCPEKDQYCQAMGESCIRRLSNFCPFWV